MNQIQVYDQYNQYPDVILFDPHNPTLRVPAADCDLYFYETKETLMDAELYRRFIKNAITRFRRSEYYKTYKSYLMSLGFDRDQVMGNITTEDVGDRGIELHHNILNLFDIALMICEHTVNTVGVITTFDLIQLLIYEHQANRIPITFLSETSHQLYTVDRQGYIPPNMTFGRWWELLSRYRYGITLEIAYKVINYIRKYNNMMPVSIDVTQQDQILSFAAYNTYGEPKQNCGYLPYEGDDEYDQY